MNNAIIVPGESVEGKGGAERAAVNALKTLLEDCDLVVQEVEGSNDYGKDLIVDLAEGDEITGEVIAFQSKGGNSFNRSGKWIIPAPKSDVRLWRESSVPVYGTVHDPGSNILRWVNLSEFARGEHLPKSNYWIVDSTHEIGSQVEVPEENILNVDTLDRFLEMARIYIRQSGRSSFLALWGNQGEDAAAAIYDCFVVGRTDARALIMLRYSIPQLKRYDLADALHVLSHATPHPDIYWSSNNWIPTRIEKLVRPHFRWTPKDLVHIFGELVELEQEEAIELWGRGTLGQSLSMLVAEDPDRVSILIDAVALAAASNNTDIAINALLLAQYESEISSKIVLEVIENHPSLLEHSMTRELVAIVKEHGRADLF